VYVQLPTREAVARVEPDFARLSRLPAAGANVFAGEGTEYKTRMFHPSVGVFEDSATGSAAGPLAVHLVKHGRLEPGKELHIQQGAELGRPSELYARVEGSSECIERVDVGGSAVIVARGEFRLPI
jgi:trans-2,3-dihydro-3-hydroxyanthranilate isomerase